MLMKGINMTRQFSEGNLPDAPAHLHQHAFKELGPLIPSSFQNYNPTFPLFGSGVPFCCCLVFHNSLLVSSLLKCCYHLVC